MLERHLRLLELVSLERLLRTSSLLERRLRGTCLLELVSLERLLRTSSLLERRLRGTCFLGIFVVFSLFAFARLLLFLILPFPCPGFICLLTFLFTTSLLAVFGLCATLPSFATWSRSLIFASRSCTRRRSSYMVALRLPLMPMEYTRFKKLRKADMLSCVGSIVEVIGADTFTGARGRMSREGIRKGASFLNVIVVDVDCFFDAVGKVLRAVGGVFGNVDDGVNVLVVGGAVGAGVVASVVGANVDDSGGCEVFWNTGGAFFVSTTIGLAPAKSGSSLKFPEYGEHNPIESIT